MNKSVPKSYFDKPGWSTDELSTTSFNNLMNRRVRNRTYGGVGGRRK